MIRSGLTRFRTWRTGATGSDYEIPQGQRYAPSAENPSESLRRLHPTRSLSRPLSRPLSSRPLSSRPPSRPSSSHSTIHKKVNPDPMYYAPGRPVRNTTHRKGNVRGTQPIPEDCGAGGPAPVQMGEGKQVCKEVQEKAEVEEERKRHRTEEARKEEQAREEAEGKAKAEQERKRRQAEETRKEEQARKIAKEEQARRQAEEKTKAEGRQKKRGAEEAEASRLSEGKRTPQVESNYGPSPQTPYAGGPSSSRPSPVSTFKQASNAIDSQSVQPQTPDAVFHQHYQQGKDVPYEPLRVLGHGAYGLVEEVKPLAGKVPMHGRIARKTIRMPPSMPVRVRERIKNEVDIVKRLNHHHIIQVLATYSEGRQFGIIMAPVAEMNLEGYFDENPQPKLDDRMYSWFGCLAAGLNYLHTERVKHRDIKPANILIDGRGILYTDFGIARDVLDEVTTSTTGFVDGKTPMYCAPEVAAEARRGRLSDLFSLGCVFLEMVTVLMWDYEVSLEKLHDFKETNGKRTYSANIGKSLEWILSLVACIKHHSSSSTITPVGIWTNYMHDISSAKRQICFALEWCVAMMQPVPDNRINASRLLQLIRAVDARQGIIESSRDAFPWIGDCCRIPAEDPSTTAGSKIIERWPDISLVKSSVSNTSTTPEHGLSAYTIFAMEQHGKVRDEDPGIPFEQVDEVLQAKWKALDPKQYTQYEATAAAYKKPLEAPKEKYSVSHHKYLAPFTLLSGQKTTGDEELELWDRANELMGYTIPGRTD
ncbi:hypothetical protein FGG08_006403 [Glutinoglossum americanum]|uniref:Protein kinase domain-containing protein n=1 Tax=Glutinoglossum americanum TaxID=1670608 RepID=A0A9P8I1M7_9PEZI|nr:hypothetical protein FGG08_006403 [Glutinoglossum americanum]